MNIVKAEVAPNLRRQGRLCMLFKAIVIGERDQNSVCAQIYLKKKKAGELLRGRVGGSSELLCSQSKGKVSFLVTASRRKLYQLEMAPVQARHPPSMIR